MTASTRQDCVEGARALLLARLVANRARGELDHLFGRRATVRDPGARGLVRDNQRLGSALARKAQALTDAGLRRITVSLDGLDN